MNYRLKYNTSKNGLTVSISKIIDDKIYKVSFSKLEDCNATQSIKLFLLKEFDIKVNSIDVCSNLVIDTYKLEQLFNSLCIYSEIKWINRRELRLTVYRKKCTSSDCTCKMYHIEYNNSMKTKGEIKMKTVKEYALDLACMLYDTLSNDGVEEVYERLVAAAGYDNESKDSMDETEYILDEDMTLLVYGNYSYKDLIDASYEYINTQAIPDKLIK